MKFIFLCFILFAVIINAHGAPAMAIKDSNTIDFGTFPANKKQSATFIIKNIGDEPLKIIRVRKTCGCSANKLSRKIIPPGQSATLISDIIENSIRGSFRKSVYIESNASNFRFFQLTLSGNAVPLVQVLPKRFLHLGVLTPEKSKVYSFKLKATQEDVKLKLMPIKTNFPVIVSLKQVSDKEFLLKTKVTPKKSNHSLKAKIIVNIVSPRGWGAIEIQLMGETSNTPFGSVAK